MLNDIAKTAEEINAAAMHYRRIGEPDQIRELAKENTISRQDAEDFIKGTRYRLMEIPVEEKNFQNACEKLREEMFAIGDRYFGDVIAQYVANLTKTDDGLDTQVLLPHKRLQRCLDYILKKAYELAEEEAKKRGQERVPANTGVALTGDQVFPWAEEYYRLDDKEETEKKEAEEKEKIQEEWNPRKVPSAKRTSAKKTSSGKKGKDKVSSKEEVPEIEAPEAPVQETVKAETKKAGKKEAGKKEASGQMSLFDMMGPGAD